MLTPSASAAIEPLRQKISSKMTVLSVLAGFSLAVIGTVLVALPDDTVPRLLAAVGPDVLCVRGSNVRLRLARI